MKDLENNKIVAAVVIAGLIALICGKIADGLYHPVKEPAKRGYAVEVVDVPAGAEPKEEAPIDIAALMAAADADKGAKTYKKCASCHTYNPGGAHRIGPNLANIVNAKIAAKDGFSYSGALEAKGDKSWNYEELFAFLKKPKDYAPGTKMTFAGFRKPTDIANVIKFLESN